MYSVGVTAGMELLDIIVWPSVQPTSAPFRSLTNFKKKTILWKLYNKIKPFFSGFDKQQRIFDEMICTNC